MFIMLITENESINKTLSQIAQVVFIKDVQRALVILETDEFDEVVVSEPFNTDSQLLQVLEERKIRYVVLNKPEDLKQYAFHLKTKEINTDKSSELKSPIKEPEKSYSQEPVLLVTTNRNTIDFLQEFNITVATTPYSAAQQVQNKSFRAVIWDLPVEPITVNTLMCIWERDLRTKDELDFVLTNGKLQVTVPISNTNKTSLITVSKQEIAKEQAIISEINTTPIEQELKNIQKIKEHLDESANSKNTKINWNLFKKISFQKKSKNNFPVPVVQKIKPKNSQKGFMIFVKSGIIVNNQFVKIKFNDPREIIVDYDALVIPANKGIGFVKKFRRQNPLKPIVVIKGNKAFLKAGADKCVSKITPDVIDEVYILISRIQELWSKAETDPLTGLYTRGFLSEWMKESEQRNRYYSAVILDIDKFKGVNDTYGHTAGDAVLAALGSFLKEETRTADLAARYGGEEFVVCLPDTTANEAHFLIDRLRQKWSQRSIIIPDGRSIKTTFSAGVAEWYPGCDIIGLADKMLYQAKETGRNRVCVEAKPNVLLMGVVGSDIRVNIVNDPKEATFVITNAKNIKLVPQSLPIYCIGTGSVADWSVKQTCPNAVMCSSFEDAVTKIVSPKTESFFLGDKTKLTVLPGARGSNKGITLPYHGALYVVCPSRPAQAGEICARLIEQSMALVCATPESMAALSLGVSKDTLIESDWRIPGSKAPIKHDNIMIWAVDPYKYLNIPANVHSLVDQIKSRFSLVLVDCGGSLDVCSRIAKDEGVLVLAREGDKSDETTQYWLQNYGGQNVAVFTPTEIPNILSAENGFVLSKMAIAAQK
ncbi:GGDEF domain-containing protein [Syntrophomonas palmitatica]|uniref:GGDEF domain-containing protein n=1 Tax=Syntrophomonas palmitatica TaxID=402877 RepID=UPI0006D11009|nr:GGDEF domain-containing protein [Syntrophomonas palmitatica]